MAAILEDILTADSGLIVAPAGCGKTQLIVEAIKASLGKPTLVLTHTNAGVAALQNRIKESGITGKRYRVTTIDGWALRILSLYPFRSGYEMDPLERPDYLAAREAAFRLCQSCDIDEILRASYGRIFVDEYQDCSKRQHALVTELSRKIPTVVLGDPMQAVFDFGDDNLPDWDTEVRAQFPLLGELDRPWRWENAGTPDLGEWILSIRDALLSEKHIDLNSGGNRVRWRRLTGDFAQDTKNQVVAQYEIEREKSETILIVGDARNIGSRHQYARNARGVNVVEPVDLRDFVVAATRMSVLTGKDLFEEILNFAKDIMTNLYADRLRARVSSLKQGKNRKPPTAQESAALLLVEGGGYREAAAFLKSFSNDRSRYIFRRSVFTAMVDAFETALSRQDSDLRAAAISVREQRRHVGRRIPFRAVGSTLLLKGLEADHVLILDADPMTATHLYVALSRGAKSVTVFSKTPILPNF